MDGDPKEMPHGDGTDVPFHGFGKATPRNLSCSLQAHGSDSEQVKSPNAKESVM
jgi:hypothetical protein